MFLKWLPPIATEEVLSSIFSTCGEILGDVRLRRSPQDGSCMGIGWITFMTAQVCEGVEECLLTYIHTHTHTHKHTHYNVVSELCEGGGAKNALLTSRKVGSTSKKRVPPPAPDKWEPPPCYTDNKEFHVICTCMCITYITARRKYNIYIYMCIYVCICIFTLYIPIYM